MTRRSVRMTASALSAVFGLLLACPAMAQSQFEMGQQSYKDFQSADHELNVVYKKALKDSDAQSAKALKAAEKAWIAYRDAEAAYEACESLGGTIYPMEYNEALTKLTKARIKQLKAGN